MRPVPHSMHDQAAQQLRELIFAGELSPGAFMDEAALCERLTVSRTPLREALKVLVAEGLLRHEPRRGCFVAELTERDVQEIFPVIALLEGRAVFEATERVSNADMSVLEVLHQRLREHAQAGRITAYYEANYAIHEAFITLADNRWLAQVIGDLRKLLRLARHQTLHLPGRLQQSLSEHLAVFDALKRGDASGAERIMCQHVLAQRDALGELARSAESRLAAYSA